MSRTGEKRTLAEKRAGERQALEAAFQRLLAQDAQDNRLESEALRELLEEEGHVPVTQGAVALEAGLSRKLVTGTNPPFRDLAERIKAVRSSHGVAPTTTAQLEKLRSDNAALKQTIVVIRSKMADAILVTDRLRTELSQQKGIVVRLRKQLAGGGR